MHCTALMHCPPLHCPALHPCTAPPLQVVEVKVGEEYSLSISTLSNHQQPVTVTAAQLGAWRERGLPPDGQFARGVQLAAEAGCE